MQVSDCESGFLSAKTGFGVRKSFLRQAGKFLFCRTFEPENFFPEITAGFFGEVFLRPPPLKIKWSLPNNAMQQKQNVNDVLHFLN